LEVLVVLIHVAAILGMLEDEDVAFEGVNQLLVEAKDLPEEFILPQDLPQGGLLDRSQEVYVHRRVEDHKAEGMRNKKVKVHNLFFRLLEDLVGLLVEDLEDEGEDLLLDATLSVGVDERALYRVQDGNVGDSPDQVLQLHEVGLSSLFLDFLEELFEEQFDDLLVDVEVGFVLGEASDLH